MAKSSTKRSSHSTRSKKRKAEKTKRSKPRRSNLSLGTVINRKIFWGLIVTWCICVAFLGFFLLKHKRTSRSVAKKYQQNLLYERPTLLGIENEIQEMDAVIYHCLIDTGLYSENIDYRVEQRKTRKGLSYEFCEMLVPTGGRNAKRFTNLLKSRAKQKFSNVSIKHTYNPSRNPVIIIGINNITTHRLIFKQKLSLAKKKLLHNKPKIAIVIDDLGPVYRQAKEFLKIKVPITFSVLPFRTHSREIAQLVRESGHEVMLHLPMEPYGYPSINPGDGALLLKMTNHQIKIVTNNCINDLDSFISGVNNHMGSAFTENEGKMRIVLEVIKAKKLFFLDSLTSPHSKAYKVALSLQVPALRRDIFLDVKQTSEFIDGQLQKLISIATKKGKAVAIGHPYTITLKVLKDRLPKINKTQVQIVPVSELIK